MLHQNVCKQLLDRKLISAMQGTSVHMVANYISALRAKLVIYELNYAVVDHPQIRYFIKAMKINRPLSVPWRNVMSISDLKVLIGKCKDISMGLVYKAVFLVAYFGMLRLSNMEPHSAQSFDHSRHLCGGDVVFTSKYVKILIKWTKNCSNTRQNSCIVLAQTGNSPPVHLLSSQRHFGCI